LNADRLGVPRPIICQPYYNAMNRTPEVEVLPACKLYGLGVAPYSPLARGILTGKYQSGKDPDENTRLGQKDGRMLETEFREESLQYAQKINEHCQKRDITPVSFAILWLLNNALISSVIAGPRTQEQWESYCDALDAEFTEADEAILNQMVSSGHPSTPGYNDPKYPITGRPLLDGPFL
ncbi:MAG: aldo/keto reductase, partial [SAR324 cluster bacterium]|nr:aldo/keto reductase [SAR324 cluster bacterium]